MALLNILRFPDPRLHTVARPVAAVDDRIRRLADDMLETMYTADGVGLAATQVDVHERLIVMDTSEQHNQPIVLINPETVFASDEMASPSRWRPRACRPCACSTRWTTCWARCSSST
jgi:peptide deformylase